MTSSVLLKLSCPDGVGLLARIASFFAARGGNLTEVHQFTDPNNGWFFVRMTIDAATLGGDLSNLRGAFEPLATELRAEWTLRPREHKPRVVMMVSKLSHCLADLLWRWKTGELNGEIVGAIGNHAHLRDLVEREGIPFLHLPMDGASKAAGFEKMAEVWETWRADLVVLARFMQIIPEDLCTRWEGRIMNIHHSFLPSFVGANPYERAWKRGVKLIGATCHYVTAELDAGPIIDQEVTRVEHFHDTHDLIRLGRDCECAALARGVRWHLDDRVFVHGGRTVVFRD